MSGATVLTEHIDPASDRAVYKQIADHLRAAVARGRLHEGEQLPSEAQLMEHYGVAQDDRPQCPAAAAGRGLITAEHGRGVYVRARPPVRRLASDRFAQRHRKEGKAAFTVESEQAGATALVDLIEVTETKPPAGVADRLELGENDRVVTRSRRYSLDGKPVETAVSYIPADLARGTPIADAEPRSRAASMPGWRNPATPWSGSPRKSPRACRPRKSPGCWRCGPACRCSGWSAPRMTPDGRAVEVCDTIMASDAYLLAYDLPAH